jgi:hypothetical protein
MMEGRKERRKEGRKEGRRKQFYGFNEGDVDILFFDRKKMDMFM